MYNREYTPELPDADSGSVLVKKIQFRKWYRDFFVSLHSNSKVEKRWNTTLKL